MNQPDRTAEFLLYNVGGLACVAIYAASSGYFGYADWKSLAAGSVYGIAMAGIEYSRPKPNRAVRVLLLSTLIGVAVAAAAYISAPMIF